MWDYHFAGMDNFYDKPAIARQNIMNALDKLDKLAKDNPNGILLAVFFQAKSDELVGVFSGAALDEKSKALTYLRDCDPSNSAKYNKLQKKLALLCFVASFAPLIQIQLNLFRSQKIG